MQSDRTITASPGGVGPGPPLKQVRRAIDQVQE